MTPAVYAAAERVAALPRLGERVTGACAAAAAIVVATIAMALALVWELFEWGLDAALGTNLSLGYTDTLVDMALGAVSALLAAGFVIAWGERARSGVERA